MAERTNMWRLREGRFDLMASTITEPALVQYLAENPISTGRDLLAGRAVLEGRAIHVPDMSVDPEFASQKQISRSGARTMLVVPLVREGEPIGVLSLSKPEVSPFTDKQIELVGTFADQAVIAIENTRLFEAEQARTRELGEALEQQTATSEVLQVISSSPGALEPGSRPCWRTRYVSAMPSSARYSATTESCSTGRPELARRPQWLKFRSSAGRFCRNRQAGSMECCRQGR